MKTRYLPLVCFLGTIIFTFFASTLPLNGVTQADISNKFFTLLTPAPYTFSIWSVIYLSWFVVSILIAYKDIKVDKEKKILFSLSMILTNFWLMTWHFSHIGFSLLIILSIAIILGFLYFDLKEEHTDIKFISTIEMFFSWIMVASLLNILVFLQYIGYQGEGTVAISIAFFLVLLGFIVHLLLLNHFRAYLATFVYIWALVGVWIGQTNMFIKLVAVLFALALVINFMFLRKKAYKKVIHKLIKG